MVVLRSLVFRNILNAVADFMGFWFIVVNAYYMMEDFKRESLLENGS